MPEKPAAAITLVFLVTTITTADIVFVRDKDGKTVPVENFSFNQQQNSKFSSNNAPMNRGVTFSGLNTPSQTTIEQPIPRNSRKQELNYASLKSTFPINSLSESGTAGTKGKFSPLLDTDTTINTGANDNSRQMERDTKSANLITNTDIQVLQKFVKKLKSSAVTNGSNSRENNANEITHNPSSNQEKVLINIPNAIPSQQEMVKFPPNLNSMSKSDVDALLSVAKEWKRLHSEDITKQQSDNKIKNSVGGKDTPQKIVANERNGGNSSLNSQRTQNLDPQRHDYKETQNLVDTFGERNPKKKLNYAPLSSATNLHGTGMAIWTDPSKTLKETVNAAIANTTQQLLQFIKLEKQLKSSIHGSSMSGSSKDNSTNSLLSLINTIRNSKTVGSTGEKAQDMDMNKQEELTKEVRKGHSNASKVGGQEKQGSKYRVQEKHGKQTETNRSSKQHRLQQRKKEYNKLQSQKEKDEKDQNKMKAEEQPKKKLGNKSDKQQIDDFKLHEKQRKQEKAHTKQEKHGYQEQQKQSQQQEPKKHGKNPENEEHEEKEKQKQHQEQLENQQQQIQQQGEQKQHNQREEKQQQDQESSLRAGEGQVEQELQTPEQQQDEETEQVFEQKNQNSKQTYAPVGRQEKTKAQASTYLNISTTNIPTTDDQREENVLKEARHFRLQTMKHLIASLADDPFDTWIYHQKSFDELGITPGLLKAGIVNLGSSKPMQRVVRKAVKGQNVKMLVVGGSISAGGGLWKEQGNIDGVYHRAISHWWKKTIAPVTNSKMEVHNVAIGGTDSEYFSYCINNFLENDPDIALWELSANDYNRFNERNFDPSKPLEQLTRIILQLRSHPALVYVNFFRGDTQNFGFGEKCPDSEETEVDILSRYYDLPSLSWRRMVCNLITKRTFVNKELFGDDGYHPNLLGHAQVAMLLMMYVKGVFESVLADDLENMKRFNDLDEDDVEIQNTFQLKIPAFKDPLNPKPCCWTLITPDYTKTFTNTLNEVNVLKGVGFELRNVTAWEVRTDRIQCLLATKPGALLDLSINVPVLDEDRNLPLADAQTRTLAIATHNQFAGEADIQLDELPSKTSVASPTGELKQTRVHIISEDVRPGVHNLKFRSLFPGFCLTSIMVI